LYSKENAKQSTKQNLNNNNNNYSKRKTIDRPIVRQEREYRGATQGTH